MLLSKINSKHLWYINKHWSIKSQIVIGSLLIYIVILTLLISLLVSSHDYVVSNILNSSQLIFEKQTKSEISTIWIQQQSFNMAVFRTKQQIHIINFYYQHFLQLQKKKKSMQFEQPLYCLNDSKGLDSYCWNCTMSCGIIGPVFNKSQKEQLLPLMVTTNVITSFYYAFYEVHQSLLVYFTGKESIYFCSQLGNYMPPGFSPYKRPVYQEYLKLSKNASDPTKIYFTSPLNSLFKQVRLPIIGNLLNSLDQINGYVSNDLVLLVPNQVQQNKFQNSSTYVITKQGLVAYTPLYIQYNLSQFYFNETKITGLNQTDFEQLMNYYLGLQFISNCQFLLSSNILCRYNEQLNLNYVIETKNISDSPYIQVEVLLVNDIIQLQLKENEFVDLFKQLSIKYFLIIILVCPIMLLLSQLGIHIALKELNLVIDSINTILFWHKKEYILTQIITFDEIKERQLKFFVRGLQNFSKSFQGDNKKNDECSMQESYQYPQKYYNLTQALINKLKHKIQYLIQMKYTNINFKVFNKSNNHFDTFYSRMF